MDIGARKSMDDATFFEVFPEGPTRSSREYNVAIMKTEAECLSLVPGGLLYEDCDEAVPDSIAYDEAMAIYNTRMHEAEEWDNFWKIQDEDHNPVHELPRLLLRFHQITLQNKSKQANKTSGPHHQPNHDSVATNDNNEDDPTNNNDY